MSRPEQPQERYTAGMQSQSLSGETSRFGTPVEAQLSIDYRSMSLSVKRSVGSSQLLTPSPADVNAAVIRYLAARYGKHVSKDELEPVINNTGSEENVSTVIARAKKILRDNDRNNLHPLIITDGIGDRATYMIGGKNRVTIIAEDGTTTIYDPDTPESRVA